MNQELSFGALVKNRRKELGLTQTELAGRVGCAPVTLRKIEYDALRPSTQIAEHLAVALQIPEAEQLAFVRLARREREPSPIPALPPAPEEIGQKDLRGRAIKGFELGERIGEGGYGAVYKAVQTSVERSVAIKIILPKYADRPEFIRRFEAEAQLVARLEHPHIVPLYDYWREPGVAYLVMRFLPGGSLEDTLREGPLSPGSILPVLEQICAGLHTAHQVGVIHRDIKPANILLDEEGNAYLADFGIAKNLSEANGANLTQGGTVIGSPAYMPPEQILAEPVKPQTDIYSLGVMLYELLTGRKPFAGPTPVAYIQQHLGEQLPLLAAAKNGDDANGSHAVATPLDIVIGRATAKDPRERYPDILSMLADIRRAMQPDSTVEDVAGNRPDTITPPHVAAMIELPDLENPYKGLRAFGEADAADFFGRDTLIQALLIRMAQESDLSRFLAVVGPSGSGKSSVVKAGLVPALRQGGLPDSDKWFIVEMIPGPHPLEELEAALLRVAVNPPDSLLSQLREDERGLLRAVRRILPDDGETELVLVIDQFEEIFTLVEDEELRVHFLESLLTAVLDSRSRLRVVITLRADFTDRPLQYVDFGELVRQQTEFVLPLTPDELELAITGPTRRAGLSLEPGLVALIIRDIGDQPGMLPLLQYALTELFERREGRKLTLAAYRDSGGVLGALARRAEELYGELDPAGQEAARQLFLRLVTLGEGTEDTRRRVLRSEVSQLSVVGGQSSADGRGAEGQRGRGEIQNPKSKIQNVIDQFGRYRLLTFDHDPVTRGPTIEVAHEALLREWSRLRGWLDESRSDVRLQRLLASAAEEWLGEARDPGYLLREARLDQFEGWAASTSMALTQNEQAFLEASLTARQERQAAEETRLQRELEITQKLAETEKQRAEEQTQAAGRLRRRAVFLTGALIIAGILAVAAVIFGQQASQNEQIAVAEANNRATAEANAIAEAEQRATAQANAEVERQAAIAAEATAVAERDRADTERDTAISRRLAIEVENQIDSGNFDIALLLAIEAARVDENPETWQSLRRAVVQPNPLLLTFSGHAGAISEIEGAKWNAAENRILTNSEDGTTRVWDVESGEELLTISAGEREWFPFAAWNRDETQILTGGSDAVARVWDANSGEELLTLAGHTDYIWHAAWSPDEHMILTGSDDGTTGVWDAKSGGQLQILTGHTDYIFSAMWSGDGSRILTGSLDGTARVWDVASGDELLALAADEDGVTEALWNGDESLILTTGYDHTAKLWDAETGELLQTFSGHTDFVWNAAWNRDESRILTVSGDGTARVWDTETGNQLLALTGHEEWVNQAVWNPDESLIATAGDDGSARVWDAQTGAELAVFGHQDGVMSVAWSASGDTILTGDGSGQARIWAWDTFEPEFELPMLRGNAGNYWQAEWNAAENLILTASDDSAGFLRVWDATTGQPRLDFVGHSDTVRQAWWNSDESRIVSASHDGTARIWDAETGEELLTLSGHEDWLLQAIWNRDETLVLTTSDDGTARIWDAETGQELMSLVGHEGRVTQAGWNSDESRILTASADGDVRLWDAATGETLLTFSGHEDLVFKALWISDESQILTYSFDGTARVWDASTGDELLILDDHPDGVTIAAWNGNESRILTAGIDGTAKIWEAKTGDLLQTFSGHTAPIWDAAWNKDESHIVTVGEAGFLRVWDAATGAELMAIQDNRALQLARWNRDESQILVAGIQGVRQYFVRLEDLIAVGCQRLTRNLSGEEWTQFIGDEPYQATCPDLPALVE